MMSHEERITKIIKLDLKLKLFGQVYVIIAMNIDCLKELQQLETLQLKVQQIMPPMKM